METGDGIASGGTRVTSTSRRKNVKESITVNQSETANPDIKAVAVCIL